MHNKLETLFNEPEKRYLDTKELSMLSQYVSSLPERITVYRLLRDQEVAIMQPVADAVQQRVPDANETMIEQSVRHGLMILRYVSMAMLLDDDAFVDERLKGWLPEIVKAYGTQAVDQELFSLLRKQFSRLLSPAQLALLTPSLNRVETLLMNSRETIDAPLAGLF